MHTFNNDETGNLSSYPIYPLMLWNVQLLLSLIASLFGSTTDSFHIPKELTVHLLLLVDC